MSESSWTWHRPTLVRKRCYYRVSVRCRICLGHSNVNEWASSTYLSAFWQYCGRDVVIVLSFKTISMFLKF